MIQKKRLVLVFSLLALALATVAAQSAPIVAESNGIKVSIVIKGPNAEITVTAPYTGWVAVGFDPVRRMQGANMLIGYVKDGVAYARDDFGTGQVSHGADVSVGGKDNLLSFKGTETAGVTTITFVVPLDSGDSKDVPLTKGTHQVILAASRSDSFTGMHSRVGKTTIVIP